ncbi:RDD family protein [Cesiribacter andamanensis]|uniref:RDD family protein n=1 Tax=Cesiribacter andamanensis AMV16 TaxID=1279009 RepID=M7N6Z8_9BACT|nr:RDD family protein [Cesiribacter andamanensis]EMR03011.1 RDD family protein [Cesiribacter andamanensis AMV16]
MEQPATPIRFAPFWKRLVAIALDYLLINVALSFIIALVVMVGWAGEGPTVVERGDDLVRDLSESFGPAQLLIVLGYWLYFALMHSSAWGATVGKRAMGLYVVDTDGHRLSFIQATLRFLGKILSVFTFFIGFVLAAFHPQHQALHDLLAKTHVREW